MSVDAPPLYVVHTVEAWAPGFWDAFVRAVWQGYGVWGRHMTVTSWWRSQEGNARKGGHPDSQHLIGAALDLVPADPALAAAMGSAGFLSLTEWDHVHIQAWPAGLVRRVGLLQAVGV